MVDLNDVVGGLEGMLRRLIGEHLVLEVRLAPAPAVVAADAGRIEQVLMNLVVNARDAMPEGGTISVTTSIGATCDGYPKGVVELIVADTGVGMDEPTRARIFEPFFTTKEVGKGTGLGLSTVYGIVREAGGDVAVESAPGLGTTFRIRIPRVDEPLVAPTARPPDHRIVRGTGSILVVEDEPVVRELAAQILRGRGYTVYEASGGEEALAILKSRSEPVDLLLTDVVMPGMNGRILAERVREIRSEIRVLFVSGYLDRGGGGPQMLPADAAFLEKPYVPVRLIEAVQRVLDGAPPNRG
jgi:CheY-like chemotaxis protein